jgi:hypothetical protein
MEITGKIIAVLPLRSGISQRTGNSWQMQEYVIEAQGEYPKRCVFTVFGEELINRLSITEGGIYTVTIEINAREYNGKYYNDIRATDAVELL